MEASSPVKNSSRKRFIDVKYRSYYIDQNVYIEERSIEVGGKMKVPCEVCKSAPAVHVHHVDGDMTNNSPSNLMYLCASCHKKIHEAKSKSRLTRGHFTHRCRHDILAELCEVLRKPATSTQLFHGLKTSGGGLYRYLGLARKLGLIYTLDDGKLKVTTKGLEYLEIYKKLPELIHNP